MSTTALPGDALHYTVCPSPVGELLLAGSNKGLYLIHFQQAEGPLTISPHWQQGGLALLAEARAQLTQYFAGQRQRFDLPLEPQGTAFQQRVWAALQAIPYGHTTHYGALAAQLGKPGAARAVGGANGANPLPIIIPCHRVLAAGGALGGYSAGLDIKRKLLALERGKT